MDDLLDRLAERIDSADTLESLTRPLLELLEAVSGMESTYLTRIDLAAGVQQIVYARNSARLQVPEGLSVPWGDTLCRRALDERRPVCTDVATHWGDSSAARELGLHSYASWPIYLSGGQLIGTLCAASGEQRPASERTLRVLRLFARLISQQIEREQLLQQLQESNARLTELALTDTLTGLPNRRAALNELERLLAQARRLEQSVLLAFVDLDGFKQINDQYGHEAGDQFLLAVGQRLLAARRGGDLAARLGGDEFVVFGLGQPSTEATQRFGERIADCLRGRYQLPDLRFEYPGASVGVVSSATAGEQVDALLGAADAAMYQVKQARRARQD